MAGILHMMNAPIGGSGGLTFFIDTPNINVRNLLLANGWDGVSVVNPIINIAITARIYSTSTAVAALASGTLPAGSTLTIINNGAILGRGGNGGHGNRLFPELATAGSPGGIALLTTVPTTITNLGTIGGGGGGGGGGGDDVGGAGGAGIGGARGGTSSYGNAQNSTLEYATGGSNGMPCFTPGYHCGGRGGNGGLYGQPGSTGVTGYYNGSTRAGKAGGAAGVAVNGESLITWTVEGFIYGPRIN
jgi:hypothetical protein